MKYLSISAAFLFVSASLASASESVWEKRALNWVEFLQTGNDEFSTQMSEMLNLVDGCTLPEQACDTIRVSARKYNRTAVQPIVAAILGKSVESLIGEDQECFEKRKGVPLAAIMTTGTGPFTIMQDKTEAQGTCFLRDLGDA